MHVSFPLFLAAAIVVARALLSAVLAATPVLSPVVDIPTVTATFEGPRISVFDTATESCELIDIPDAPARAYRDYKGIVHLIASHYVTRANLGLTLDEVRHDCHVVYASPQDPNPANFNQFVWLSSFFNIDGKQVVALGHVEFHGWKIAGQCMTARPTSACAYFAETTHLSVDGGYNFQTELPPANFSIGFPYKYETGSGPEGYSVDTNILKIGLSYYAMVTSSPWPPPCRHGTKPKKCDVPSGGCPIRTSTILDPASWRGWDGTDFTVKFINPYLETVADPHAHVCTPVRYMNAVNDLVYHPTSRLFIALLWDPWNTLYGPPGLYISTSLDLIHWTKPNIVTTSRQLLAMEPAGNWSYLYFSLIDPTSPDPNFSTVGNNPYLYYVRLDRSHGPYTRVLYRQKVRLSFFCKLGDCSSLP